MSQRYRTCRSLLLKSHFHRFRRCSVHFGDVGDEKAETDAHTNDIVIQRLNDEQRTLDLHLGFLQVRFLGFTNL
jgi:hypothetical protein